MLSFVLESEVRVTETLRRSQAYKGLDGRNASHAVGRVSLCTIHVRYEKSNSHLPYDVTAAGGREGVPYPIDSWNRGRLEEALWNGKRRNRAS